MTALERVPAWFRRRYATVREPVEQQVQNTLYPRPRLGVDVKTNGAPTFPKRADAPNPTRR